MLTAFERRYLSPLRYPGGKSQLLSFVSSLLIQNDLIGCDYIEPYAGGASIALGLLADGLVSRIQINDLDPSIHAFWRAAVFQSESFCRLIETTKPTITEWRRQKEIYNSKTASELERGFATFFLNRTNRSGIIESGGIIGGIKQDGALRLDARFNKKNLITRIENIAQMSDAITISNNDAEQMFAQMPPDSGSLLFIDPPYFIKGERRLYSNHYVREDHFRLARLIRPMQCHWIVTYDDVPDLEEAYRGFRKIKYNIDYSAHSRSVGREILFLSDNLKKHSTMVRGESNAFN